MNILYQEVEIKVINSNIGYRYLTQNNFVRSTISVKFQNSFPREIFIHQVLSREYLRDTEVLVEVTLHFILLKRNVKKNSLGRNWRAEW